MSDYRSYMESTQLHNKAKRKRRRHRFLFGILMSAILIIGITAREQIDISQLKNMDVVETISSAVSQFGDRKLPIYSVETSEKKVALSFDAAWGSDDFNSMM